MAMTARTSIGIARTRAPGMTERLPEIAWKEKVISPEEYPVEVALP